MRHRKSGRPLGRNSAHRRALFRNLVTSFLEHERIETTEAKAKEIRPIVERMISLGKRGDLHSRRLAASYLFDRAVVGHLFSEIAPRFAGHDGGYTRILKTRVRKGDASQMAILELTKAEAAAEEEKPAGEKKPTEEKQATPEEKKTKVKKTPEKKGKETDAASQKSAKKKAVKKKAAAKPEKEGEKEKAVAKGKTPAKKKAAKKKTDKAS